MRRIVIKDLKTGEISETKVEKRINTTDLKFCMICLEKIFIDDRIWCCNYCRAENHLKCMLTWVSSRLHQKSTQTNTIDEKANEEWSCPNCRKKYGALSDVSYCYCKKTKEPEKLANEKSAVKKVSVSSRGSLEKLAPKKLPLLPPHCCNNACGRFCETTHGAHCIHPCKLKCHSGFCPPCTENFEFKCFCGQTTLNCVCSAFRSLNISDRSCYKICSRLLNCGTHMCKKLCHENDCDICTVVLHSVNCFCGRQRKDIICGGGYNLIDNFCGDDKYIIKIDEIVGGKHRDHRENISIEVDNNISDVKIGSINYDEPFSCGKPCDKLLKCNFHRCSSPCHGGDCEPCETDISKILTCFCGKLTLSNLNINRFNCSDPIPSCNNICGKNLTCYEFNKESGFSSHVCEHLCHSGCCPPCEKSTIALCQCKKSRVLTPCKNLIFPNISNYDENINSNIKSQLNSKFISTISGISSSIISNEISKINLNSKAISNGNSRSNEIFKFLTSNEKCNKKCKKYLNCKKHKCENVCCTSLNHECLKICQKNAPCNIHLCNKRCHPGDCQKCTFVYNYRVYCVCRNVYLDPPYVCSRFLECKEYCPQKCSEGHNDLHQCHRFDLPCPPCAFLVSKMCVNNHTLVKVACSVKNPYCSSACNKLLECGHKCSRFCHLGSCIDDKNICQQRCLKIKVKCGHQCNLPCSIEHNCPDPSCSFTITVRCPCEYRSYNITCDDYFWFTSLVVENKSDLIPQILDNKKICMLCDHECKIKQRLLQLANAFGIDPSTDPDLARKTLPLDKNSLLLILKSEYGIE